MSIVNPLRSDCAERYEAMREIIPFSGKSLIDIGCSNGYFMDRFREDGGLYAIGVDPDEQYKRVDIVRSINDVSGPFDICFYLDLHYHNEIDYFPWIRENVIDLFVAPSGCGNNKRLEMDLIGLFGNFTYVVNTAYANRNIYHVRVRELS